MTSRYLTVLPVFMMFLAVLTPCTPADADGHGRTNHKIPEGEFSAFRTYTQKGDLIEYEVEAREGKRVDVYIMSRNEYEKYKAGEDFAPVKKHHNRDRVESRYDVPGDQEYLIVMDNKDNVKGDDAKPRGNVTIDFYYEYGTPRDMFKQDVLPFLVFFGAVGVIAAIAGPIVWFAGKKKRIERILASHRIDNDQQPTRDPSHDPRHFPPSGRPPWEPPR